MILCVNANAALDKTVVVEDFRLNAIHRPQEVIVLPGGKGANVARVLRTLGEEVVVTGWTGGHAGRFIEEALRAEGIESAFVDTGVESRTCLSIVDHQAGTVTEIYERGAALTEENVAALKQWFQHNVGHYALVTLSGSLPPGVPVDFYAELSQMAQAAGVPALLDSSGQALATGLEAGPTLVKPNRKEFLELVGLKEEESEQIARMAGEMADRTGTNVLVSLGAEGAVLANGNNVWLAQPPEVTAVSAVGSGDALLAGIGYGWVRGWAPKELLRCGVAAGTANTLLLGAGRLQRPAFEKILPQVRVQALE